MTSSITYTTFAPLLNPFTRFLQKSQIHSVLEIVKHKNTIRTGFPSVFPKIYVEFEYRFSADERTKINIFQWIVVGSGWHGGVTSVRVSTLLNVGSGSIGQAGRASRRCCQNHFFLGGIISGYRELFYVLTLD